MSVKDDHQEDETSFDHSPAQRQEFRD